MTTSIVVWLLFIAIGAWAGLAFKQRPLAGAVCGAFGLIGLIVLAFLPTRDNRLANQRDRRILRPPDVVGVDTDPTLTTPTLPDKQ